MSGTLSNYAEAKLLDHMLGNDAWTVPGTVYAALFTVAPTSAGGGTEVTGGSYARVAVTNNGTNWPAATPGGAGTPAVKENGTAIVFPTATADWGLVVAMGVYNAASSGNLLYYSTLSQNKNVYTGDTAQFSAGATTLSLL